MSPKAMYPKARMIASVLLIVSYFLPWMQDGWFGIITVSPFQTLGRTGLTGNGSGLLLLALPVAGALALWRPHDRKIGLVGGAVAFVLTLVTLIRILSAKYVGAQFGVWLALFASAVLAATSFMQDGPREGRIRRTTEYAGRNLAAQDMPAHDLPAQDRPVAAAPCPACGAPVRAEFKFCGKCGAPLGR